MYGPLRIAGVLIGKNELPYLERIAKITMSFVERTPLLGLSQMSRDEMAILMSGMITPDANRTVLHVDLS